MSKARLVITAVVTEGRSQTEVARTYGVSQSWISKLVARYHREGEARLRAPLTPTAPHPRPPTPDHRRPHRRSTRRASRQRPRPRPTHHRLAPAPSPRHHRRNKHHPPPPTRRRPDHPTPQKRPKSSYIRFAAEQPNERWQADFTHWWLADGTHTENARYALSVTAHRRVTGAIVLTEFRNTVARHGIPCSTLTDNGMVFTTRLSGGKGGRNAFEAELRQLGVTQINSTPNHPTTCGKVERFHQTLKRWLQQQQPKAATIDQLQAHLDAFVDEYNHRRPHRSLPQHATPATAYTARPKAHPANRTDTHNRVRRDRVDTTGALSLRLAGRLHHIGVGRTHAGTCVLMLICDLNVRIINAATGELIRELTIDPTRDYQPRGVKPGPKRKKPEP